MSTKDEIKQSVTDFLATYSRETPVVLSFSDQREALSSALVDHLEEQQMLNLTDSAEVEEEKQADDIVA